MVKYFTQNNCSDIYVNEVYKHRNYKLTRGIYYKFEISRQYANEMTSATKH